MSCPPGPISRRFQLARLVARVIDARYPREIGLEAERVANVALVARDAGQVGIEAPALRPPRNGRR